jgi:hypothetical protein
MDQRPELRIRYNNTCRSYPGTVGYEYLVLYRTGTAVRPRYWVAVVCCVTVPWNSNSTQRPSSYLDRGGYYIKTEDYRCTLNLLKLLWYLYPTFPLQ